MLGCAHIGLTVLSVEGHPKVLLMSMVLTQSACVLNSLLANHKDAMGLQPRFCSRPHEWFLGWGHSLRIAVAA